LLLSPDDSGAQPLGFLLNGEDVGEQVGFVTRFHFFVPFSDAFFVRFADLLAGLALAHLARQALRALIQASGV
jgi:hypothetical protein